MPLNPIDIVFARLHNDQLRKTGSPSEAVIKALTVMAIPISLLIAVLLDTTSEYFGIRSLSVVLNRWVYGILVYGSAIWIVRLAIGTPERQVRVCDELESSREKNKWRDRLVLFLYYFPPIALAWIRIEQ